MDSTSVSNDRITLDYPPPSSSSTSSSQYMIDDFPIQKVFIAILICVIAVVGVVGNVLLVFALFLCRQLRSATNTFIASLAVCNFITCVTSPFHVSTILRKFPPKQNGCVFMAITVISTQIISLLTLTLIAVNRVLLIRGQRITYDKIYTNRYVFIMIAVSWILPVLLLILASSVGFATLGFNNKYKICVVDSSKSGIASLVAGIVVGIPCFLIIFVSYALVFVFIRKRHMHMRSAMQAQNFTRNPANLYKARRPSDNELTRVGSIRGSLNRSNSLHSAEPNRSYPLRSISACVSFRSARAGAVVRQKSNTERMISIRQNKVTRNLFVIVCVFVVCLLPFLIAIIHPDANAVIPWFAILLFLNSATNPIIHGFLHPQLRVVFRKILTCRVNTIPEIFSLFNASHT
ncbi:G-protein coupled receptor moody-like [Apostichopus japonicus]|uniref:G-protein coupled receptor moody-like n=1 Tax=Stichopus japonicus TaxID=307972 RepID=UPI003AB10977